MSSFYILFNPNLQTFLYYRLLLRVIIASKYKLEIAHQKVYTN